MMSISSAVAELTELVADHCGSLTRWEEDLRSDLAQFPKRVAEKDLGWWESHFAHVWSHGPAAELSDLSKAARLFSEIFDFGSYSLFGAFDSDGTRSQYERLLGTLNRTLDTAIQPSHDVTSCKPTTGTL